MFLAIEETSVSKAWIRALQDVLFEGDLIKSQYDTEDDFPTRDCTSAIHVTDPLSDPLTLRGKKMNIKGFEVYCHPADLYCIESIKSGYLDEVMTGKMDHLIYDSKESYPYTYHDRLFNYRHLSIEDFNQQPIVQELLSYELRPVKGINQINEMKKKLSSSPYSRRAQATTWRPIGDNMRSDPPCLQRIWARIFDGKMRLNTHWRSRDLFGAWSANVNGMIQIGKKLSEELGVEFAEYYDFCDSLHIYGKKKKIAKELIPILQRIETKKDGFDEKYEEKLRQLEVNLQSWNRDD